MCKGGDKRQKSWFYKVLTQRYWTQMNKRMQDWAQFMRVRSLCWPLREGAANLNLSAGERKVNATTENKVLLKNCHKSENRLFLFPLTIMVTNQTNPPELRGGSWPHFKNDSVSKIFEIKSELIKKCTSSSLQARQVLEQEYNSLISMGTERRPDEVSAPSVWTDGTPQVCTRRRLSGLDAFAFTLAGRNEDLHPLALLEEDVQGEGPPGRDLRLRRDAARQLSCLRHLHAFRHSEEGPERRWARPLTTERLQLCSALGRRLPQRVVLLRTLAFMPLYY